MRLEFTAFNAYESHVKRFLFLCAAPVHKQWKRFQVNVNAFPSRIVTRICSLRSVKRFGSYHGIKKRMSVADQYSTRCHIRSKTMCSGEKTEITIAVLLYEAKGKRKTKIEVWTSFSIRKRNTQIEIQSAFPMMRVLTKNETEWFEIHFPFRRKTFGIKVHVFNSTNRARVKFGVWLN